MVRRNLTYLEFKEDTAAKRAHWSRRDAVRTAIDYGAAALHQGESAAIRPLVTDVLAPALVGEQGRDIDRYHQRLGDDRWAPLALQAVLDGSRDPRRVEAAFRACVAIAEAEDIVGDVQNHAEARGLELQLGRLWSQFEMDVGDQVGLVTRDSGWPKTLACGKTGRGKSATIDHEVADRWAAGQKIVDVLDTDEFESALYDVPQGQPTLQDAREELGLDGQWPRDELPDLEVLVPLTPATAEMRAPYDEADETVVRPFTIPAASLDETTVVSLLAAMTSKQQEASLRTAYRELDDRDDDWTLNDLADTIADRDDLKSKFQQRVLRLLEDLQRRGFIRDHEDEHAIDWEEIFRSQHTVTAFSVAPMAEETDQMMVLSYLMNQLYAARRTMNGLPPCAAVVRELHEIVPHRNEASEDNRTESLQGGIAANLSYTMKKNRHVRLELLADTQNISDLKKGVRKRFSRFVAFKQPAEDLKELFDVLGENGYQSCKSAMPNEAGQGAVIGSTRAALSHGLSFLAPIQFAPAPFHHFDVDENASGLHARTELLDEELHPVPWDLSVPTRLTFVTDEKSTGTATETKAAVPFIRDCMEEEMGATVDIDDVEVAYHHYAAEMGIEPTSRNWFARYGNEETEITLNRDKNEGVYLDLTLNERGKEHLSKGGEAADNGSVDAIADD